MTQTPEEQAIETLTRMGFRDQLSEVDWDRSVRDEANRIADQASTPLVSVRSALKTLRRPAKEIPPLPPRQFQCAACEDQRFVFTGTRSLDGDRVVRTNAIPCPKCVPLASRALAMGIGERFAHASIETMRVHPGNAAAVAYAKTWDGAESVLITSTDKPADSKWGTGKTHLASAMLIGQIAKAKRGRFVLVKDFLAGIQAQFGGDPGAVQGYLEVFASEPFLVLDDLGGERPTDWVVEQLRALFDARYRRRLTTIVTTNFTGYEEIAAALGGAVASRLREYQWITVGGADQRGMK